jgi:hexosaminidase
MMIRPTRATPGSLGRVFAMLLLAAAPALAEHRRLLPRPQQIRYGPARLPVCSTALQLPAGATDDDGFAAAGFARTRTSHCGTSPAGEAAITVEVAEPGPSLPVPGEAAGPDSREAYSLAIGASGGRVWARSSAGLFYAVQTLGQLIEGEGPAASLPEVEVRDWPQLAGRGTMVDASHGPRPTVDEIERQIDFLARFKANQYYLYSEASIELDGYPLLNPEARYSKADIRRIVAYARERHVDVVPTLELYGHLHDLLRVEHYSTLGSFPHGPEVDPANPEVMRVFADWAGQIADLFPSRFVHVGFDETWQIEMAAKKEGGRPADLFTRQLRAVADLFRERGKTVMAWGDIVVNYPGIVDQLPPGLVPVAWDYDAQPDVKRWLDPLVARKLPHVVATGVANWHEVAVDFDLTFANIDNFLAAARRSGATGLMNTVWLDSSYSPLRMARPAMAYGAAAAWQSGPMDRAGFFEDYSALTFPARVAPDVAAALDRVSRSEVTLQKVLGQDCFYELWESPFDPERRKRSTAHREDLRQARLLAEEAESRVYAALDAGGDPESLRSLLFGARMLDYAAFRYLNALEIAERWQQIASDFHPELFWHLFESEVSYQSHSRLVDLMDAITGLREAYRDVWLAEYAPYRLGTTLGRFDAEYQYWRALQSRFRNVARGLAGKKSLPPLDSVLKDPTRY